MKNMISTFIADESGAGAVEYALMLLLGLSIVVLAGTTIKPLVVNMLTLLSGKMTAAVTSVS